MSYTKSFYAYIACVLFIAYVAVFFYPKWEHRHGESSLGYDAATYYWYLPAMFVYKDLKQQKFGDSIINKYKFTPTFEPIVHKSGNIVQVYTAGVAVLQLPAFAVAHLLAEPLGYEADGFSLPYQVAVQLWSILWAIIGLWYFRRLLLYYFSDDVVAITLLLLVFGTNYLNYNAIDVTLTHSWLFTGYVFLMLATRSFYTKPNLRDALAIGIITGLLILIRPSETIAAIIPLLWGMERISLKSIRDRLIFYKDNYKHLLIAIACVVAVGMIQVAYWLYVTGQPLVYSYTDKGFTWKSPHFFNYTFSYRSGWLVYTPLLFFAFIGLLPFLKYGKNKVAVIMFFLLNYYIISAWDIWWYGGMGGRAMVQSYAVAFFIIATLVEWLGRRKWIKWPVYIIMLLFVYINIWFTYNAHAGYGLYDPTAMTKKYFWSVVGRFKVPDNVMRYKDTDEMFDGKATSMQLLYQQDFEQDTTADSNHVLNGKRSLYFDASKTYSPFYRFAYQPGQADWLRTTANIKMVGREWETWKMIQLSTRFKERDSVIKIREIRINHIINSMEGQIYFDIKIPQQRFDSVELLFWNPGSALPMIIDDVKVSSFKE